MKYLYIVLIAFAFTGCKKIYHVEFTGSFPGINNGAIVIKDLQGNILISEDIFDGKFHTKKILQAPGYYDMYITADLSHDARKKVYDIYLEDGTYTVAADVDKLYRYPTIGSTSKIQNELSEYYTASSEKTNEADVSIKNLYALMYDKNSPAAGNSDELTKQLNAALESRSKIQADVLGHFISKHPNNEVEAHIMSELDYKKDPVSYNAVYQKFSDAQKNTADGKEIAGELGQLMKLAPGALAPPLAGSTPGGKPFDPKTISAKIILVDFWRSDNEVSRYNHNQLVNGYYSPIKNKNFTVISVCLDTIKEQWTAAIKKDGMTWAQVSDLKGAASQNMANWAVGTIPAYELVDGSWHFIKHDVDFAKLGTEVNDYLKISVANRPQ